MFRRTVLAAAPRALVMLAPSYRMSPLVGEYRPSSSRPKVVFPEPVSPTSASVWPRRMSSETSSIAFSTGLLPTRPWPTEKYRETLTVEMIGVSGSAADIGALLADVGAQPVPACSRATVDFEHGAGHMTGLRTGEEQHRRRDVHRVPADSQRNLVDQ